MAEERTRSVRIRSRAAGLLAAAYVVALASFWAAGTIAYLQVEHGAAKLLGFLYFPILLLPWVGHGSSDTTTIGAIQVHSPIWIWWFALQMALGMAAMLLYPVRAPAASTLGAGAPRADPGQVAGRGASFLTIPVRPAARPRGAARPRRRASAAM